MSKTVHLAIDLLELLADGMESARLTDLAERLERSKATVHRTLAALQERGYVVQRMDERYALGVRCLDLGARYADGLDLRAVARPLLEALRDDTDETVHLALYERGDVVYVDKVDSPLPVAPKSRVGMRAPATAIATGRALLAFQHPDEIDRALAQPLPAYTEQSITDPAELRALLDDVRATDRAINRCSWRDGVSGVAVPIRDHTGVVVASVGCCVPESRFADDARRAALQDAVRATATEISARLGHRSRG